MSRRIALLLALSVALVVALGIGALALRESDSPDGGGPPRTTPPDASCATQRAGGEMPVGTSVHRERGESYEQAWQRRASTWGAEPEMARFFYPGLPVGDWPEFGDAQVEAWRTVPSALTSPGLPTPTPSTGASASPTRRSAISTTAEAPAGPLTADLVWRRPNLCRLRS